MKIRWSKRALTDLLNLHAWLSTLPRAKPDRTILRIRDAAERLVKIGDVGRPSRKHGQRELSVPRAPYVIVYRVEAGAIEILAVYHTAQNR